MECAVVEVAQPKIQDNWTCEIDLDRGLWIRTCTNLRFEGYERIGLVNRTCESGRRDSDLVWHLEPAETKPSDLGLTRTCFKLAAANIRDCILVS